MLAFIIWCIFGAAFIIFGIYCIFSRKAKAFGFWANAETFPVKDVKGYNRAVGKLWCGFGAVLVLLGIPLLGGQNSAGAVFTVLGMMTEVIVTMVIYVTVIEKKYRKQS